MAVQLQPHLSGPPHWHSSCQPGWAPPPLQLPTCSLASGLCSRGSVCWPSLLLLPTPLGYFQLILQASAPFPGKTSLTLINAPTGVAFLHPPASPLPNPYPNPALLQLLFHELRPPQTASQLSAALTSRGWPTACSQWGKNVHDKGITHLLFCLL